VPGIVIVTGFPVPLAVPSICPLYEIHIKEPTFAITLKVVEPVKIVEL